MRGVWLVLPLLAAVALHGAFTLLGQPPGGAAGMNPASAYFLALGPRAFCLALAAWAGIAILIAWALPGMLGQAFYAAAGLGHAAAALGWVLAQGPRILSALGSRLGAPAGRLLGEAAGSPHAAQGLALAVLVLLGLWTVFCWRWAGLLPAGAAKPKPAAGKEGKD